MGRTPDIDGLMRLIESTIVPFSSARMMFECFPINSQYSVKRVGSPSSLEDSMPTASTRSIFACSKLANLPPVMRFRSSMQNIGASAGDCFLTSVSCTRASEAEALRSKR
jgi:hypothetical protein